MSMLGKGGIDGRGKNGTKGRRRSTWFILSILAIEVVSLSALVWNSVRIITTSHAQLIESSAVQVNDLLSHSVARGLAADDPALVQDALNLLHNNDNLVYVTVLDRSGRVVGALGNPPERFREDPGVRESGGDGVYDTASPIRLYGQRLGTLHTGHSLERGRAFTAQTRLQNTVIAGIEIVLTILATLLLGLFFTRNLRRLEEGALALSKGDYGYRIPVSGQDEFAHVAKSFNQMAENLTTAQAELEEKNRALERQARHFRTLLDGVEAVVVEGDPTTRQLTYVSQEAGNLLGHPVAEWFRPGFWLDHIHPEDQEAFLAELSGHQGEPGSFTHDFRMLHHDGHAIWVRAINAVDRDEDGALILRGLLLDVTEEKRSAERIIYLADHDPLTDLFNRGRFQEELERNVTYAQSYGHEGALLVLGLDRFKYINDTLGHGTGDYYLRRVASALNSLVGDVDILGRLGGDEFAVIRPLATAEEIRELAERIRARLARPLLESEQYTSAITASMGVVFFPRHGVHADDLLAKADAALGTAKEEGRDRLHVYHEGDEAIGRMRAKIKWEDRIRRALREDRFLFHYQPIIRLDSRIVSHYEVLLRMEAEGGELVGPGAFLDTAERFGMIGEIDRWVLENAIRVQGESRRVGRPVTLAVNLSGRHLGRADILELMNTAIESHGADPRALIFEVTETAAVENISHARQFIHSLQERGCRVALDDFGVGLSSFHYLKNLPVDMVKIDGSFVRALDRDDFDRRFVRAMSDLAESLGIESVGEFVESQRIADLLRELGVDMGQGFHLGPPTSGFLGDSRQHPNAGKGGWEE
ncbi:putative bifunctional diguanylate cyclase/phosphodiesterase [Thiohalorhabdus sp. Cl-TMA]|uniref:Bifunctional diguanylate cyclase/phosphodiesterase n=1 Tax=Thiohalorhabdus methylotrophus TaxID=3242694 RepID=A0ABV4TXF5_9GAMM